MPQPKSQVVLFEFADGSRSRRSPAAQLEWRMSPMKTGACISADSRMQDAARSFHEEQAKGRESAFGVILFGSQSKESRAVEDEHRVGRAI